MALSGGDAASDEPRIVRPGVRGRSALISTFRLRSDECALLLGPICGTLLPVWKSLTLRVWNLYRRTISGRSLIRRLLDGGDEWGERDRPGVSREGCVGALHLHRSQGMRPRGDSRCRADSAVCD